LYQVKSAGRALAKPANHVNKIPLDKRTELKNVIAEHFGLEEKELTEQHIKEASELNSRSSIS